MKASIHQVLGLLIGLLIAALIIVVVLPIALKVKASGDLTSTEALILLNCKAWYDRNCDPPIMGSIFIKQSDGEEISLERMCRNAYAENYLKKCASMCCNQNDKEDSQ